jgi:hypothetical protein
MANDPFAESIVEEAAHAWFGKLGYAAEHCTAVHRRQRTER